MRVGKLYLHDADIGRQFANRQASKATLTNHQFVNETMSGVEIEEVWDMGLAMDEWIVAWNRVKAGSGESGAVEVGPNAPDGWTARYEMSSGARDGDRRNMTAEGKVMMMLLDFHKLVIGYGVDPQVLHREFLKIDEYRLRIAEDLPGAAF